MDVLGACELQQAETTCAAMSSPNVVRRLWGPRLADAEHASRSALVDLAIVVGLAGLFYGATRVAGEWTGALRPTVEIDLSPLALPRYAFFSLSRGLLAYVLSLGFTLVYGYWAAKDKAAERILLPLLDVLQSIPVLGFMPGLVLALVATFPTSNIGLEMAAVLMIFTGQAWNMTFSFYHSLRSVPREQLEVATLYRFGWWRRLCRVELPFATTGLVWNSMMSMAGGWFFLMINEAFVLGSKDFRLPGLGSYMSVASARGDTRAMAFAMVAMVAMIVLLDQLLWRPLVVWAQKFRVEETGQQEAMSSWFFEVIRGSNLLRLLRGFARLLGRVRVFQATVPRNAAADTKPKSAAFSHLVFVLLVLLLGYGAYRLMLMFRVITLTTWIELTGFGLLTLVRVLAATVLGTAWALPAGIAVGLSPRLQNFPTDRAGGRLVSRAHAVSGSHRSAQDPGRSAQRGSMVLMLLGTQWYIFFNVIAGAVSMPADLRETATNSHFGGWLRFRALYLPAVLPSLVTGWVTATGGAWNASIVAEYVSFKGQTLTTNGLGSAISAAAEHAMLPRLAAAVTVMSLMVVIFNRTVWHTCYRIAEERYSLDK